MPERGSRETLGKENMDGPPPADGAFAEMQDQIEGARAPADATARAPLQAPRRAPPEGGAPAARLSARPAPGAREAAPRPAAVAAAAPAPASFDFAVVETDPGAGWWRRIPERLWLTGTVLTAPLRAVVWILDGIVSAAIVGAMALAWAWWTERITDEQVAQFLGQLGARGLSVLSRSGLL